MRYLNIVCAAVVLIGSCTDTVSDSVNAVSEIEVPCSEGGEPNLYQAPNGTIHLSWIEYIDDTTDALVFSILESNQWSAPREIARGSDWFVNWADFPTMCAFDEEGHRLAAHWLQKSAAGTYDYDVHVSTSSDGGDTWGESFILHNDGIPAEHGFVSMSRIAEDSILAVWLDGRKTKGARSEDGHAHGHGPGAMTLRSAVFDPLGNIYGETELDDRVCDCCQTGIAQTRSGPIVVYRDRSADEIRDISVVNRRSGQWSEPESLWPDEWHIAGCPVNGPAISSNGQTIWIAWFTGGPPGPQVLVSTSSDTGGHFSPPLRVDSGQPLGRVDVLHNTEGQTYVSWIETLEDKAEVRIRRIEDDGTMSDVVYSHRVDPSRSSGFPKMVFADEHQIVLVWTDVGEKKRVRSVLLDMLKLDAGDI